MADYLVLTLDVNDLDRMTTFWSAALGYQLVGGVGAYKALADPADRLPKLLLQTVPEGKAAKNRLHLDLHVPDIDVEVARLEGQGAATVQVVDEFGMRWILMADPEGNEFCVCKS